MSSDDSSGSSQNSKKQRLIQGKSPTLGNAGNNKNSAAEVDTTAASSASIRKRIKRKRKNCRSQFRHEAMEIIKLGNNVSSSLCKSKIAAEKKSQESVIQINQNNNINVNNNNLHTKNNNSINVDLKADQNLNDPPQPCTHYNPRVDPGPPVYINSSSSNTTTSSSTYIYSRPQTYPPANPSLNSNPQYQMFGGHVLPQMVPERRISRDGVIRSPPQNHPTVIQGPQSVAQQQENGTHPRNDPRLHQKEKLVYPNENIAYMSEKVLRPNDNAHHSNVRSVQPSENMVHSNGKVHINEKKVRLNERIPPPSERLVHPSENVMHSKKTLVSENMVQQNEKIHLGEKMLHPNQKLLRSNEKIINSEKLLHPNEQVDLSDVVNRIKKVVHLNETLLHLNKKMHSNEKMVWSNEEARIPNEKSYLHQRLLLSNEKINSIENTHHAHERLLPLNEKTIHIKERIINTGERTISQNEKTSHSDERLIHPNENLLYTNERVLYPAGRIPNLNERMPHPRERKLPFKEKTQKVFHPNGEKFQEMPQHRQIPYTQDRPIMAPQNQRSLITSAPPAKRPHLDEMAFQKALDAMTQINLIRREQLLSKTAPKHYPTDPASAIDLTLPHAAYHLKKCSERLPREIPVKHHCGQCTQEYRPANKPFNYFRPQEAPPRDIPKVSEIPKVTITGDLRLIPGDPRPVNNLMNRPPIIIDHTRNSAPAKRGRPILAKAPVAPMQKNPVGRPKKEKPIVPSNNKERKNAIEERQRIMMNRPREVIDLTLSEEHARRSVMEDLRRNGAGGRTLEEILLQKKTDPEKKKPPKTFMIKDLISNGRPKEQSPPRFAPIVISPPQHVSIDRRQSIDTLSSSSSTSSNTEANGHFLDSNALVPHGKLRYDKAAHSLCRYFEEDQKRLFLKATVNSSNGHELSQNSEHVIPLPRHILFNPNENLTVEEYVREMTMVESLDKIPDFYQFYKFVTGYQICNNKTPVSFLTFLSIYNTDGLKRLLDRYVSSAMRRSV